MPHPLFLRNTLYHSDKNVQESRLGREQLPMPALKPGPKKFQQTISR